VKLVNTSREVRAFERGITGSSHTYEPGSRGIDHEAAQRAKTRRRRVPQFIVVDIVVLTLPRSAAGEQTDEGVGYLELRCAQGSGRYRDDVPGGQIPYPNVVDVVWEECELSPIRGHGGGGNDLDGGRPDGIVRGLIVCQH